GSGTVYIEVGGKFRRPSSGFATISSFSTSVSVRQPGRPPRRRSFADLRRALAGRLARQADAPAIGPLRIDLAGRRSDSQGDRPLPGECAYFGRHRLWQYDALNCLTRYIYNDERIVTCEDAAELQLQQPHVVRLETRPQCRG